MCTLTWTHTATGYALCFNRDELVTRLAGLPPAPLGAHALAPRDRDGGGTWIAANADGLTLGILNGPRVDDERRPQDFSTRGEIIPRLLGDGGPDSATQAANGLAALDLDRYRGFVLVAIDAHGDAAITRWNGRELVREGDAEQAGFLSSSSWCGHDAVNHRRAIFDAAIRDKAPWTDADRLAFHRSHAPEPGPDSICMHREDASTVSLTSVRVDDTTVAMRYADGPPCEASLGPPLTLARR